ncbi:MAG: carbohydrate ABC transporter permease [Phototrophicales bacterium]
MEQAIPQTQVQSTNSNSILPKRWGVHVLLWIACFLVGFPLLYAILVSTQTNAEVTNFKLTFGTSFEQNLKAVMVNRNLGDYMLNSTLQAVIITVGKTVLSLLAGLAFVYFRFPGKWIVFGFVLITLMMPTEIMVIALFRLMSELEWGQLPSLTVPFLASATGAFLFRQHFANLPSELSEAAQLDGANPLQFLFMVLIPLSWNTIGALAVIQFVYVWNMYLWPQLLQADVVQVGLGALLNFDGSLSYGPMMMGAVVASIPPVIVFLLLQRQFMNGFAISAEK